MPTFYMFWQIMTVRMDGLFRVFTKNEYLGENFKILFLHAHPQLQVQDAETWSKFFWKLFWNDIQPKCRS